MPKTKSRSAKKSTKARSKPKGKPAPRRKVEGECLIPSRVPDEVLKHFTYKGTDGEAQQIVDYVESQSWKDKERVTFLEKVQTEHVMGDAHDWSSRRFHWRSYRGGSSFSDAPSGFVSGP